MRERRIRTLAAVAVAAWAVMALAGCGSFSVALGSCPSETRLPTAAGGSVVVRYLGVSGFLLQRGSDVILTAPMFTDPSLLEVAADHAIRPDTEQIDRFLPAEAAEARAILVGHSHYDHLMDVPYIALEKAIRADVYGSETTVRLLSPIRERLARKTPATRVVPLDGVAGDHEREGCWVPVGTTVRFMPLRSEHSAQVTLKVPLLGQPFPLHLWRGKEEGEPRVELPRSASEWAEGSVFSFVIDFLGSDGRPEFRVYFQDSGTNEPIGYPPRSLLADKAVDLVILCVGGDFERLRRHPEGILRWTQPRFVLLSHWEDFFVTQDTHEIDGRIYEIPPADERKTARFLARVRKALPAATRVWLPCPSRSSFAFPVEAGERN